MRRWRHLDGWAKVATILSVPIGILSILVAVAVGDSTGPDEHAAPMTPPSTTIPATTHPDADTTPSTLPPSTAPPTTEASTPLPYAADGFDGWVGSEGWSVVGGVLTNDGSSTSHELTIAAPIRLDDVSDYVVEAEIQLVRYGDEGLFSGLGSFGLVVRAPDDGGGYGVGACASAGIFTCDGDQSTRHLAVLWAAERQIPPAIESVPFRPLDAWHHYRAEVRGNTARLLIDGGLVLEATDNRYLAGGRVGLWSYHAQVNVRNFTVTAI